MVDLTKPVAPVFDKGPAYSDYVQNANLINPDELARRNEQFKKDRESYDSQRADILKNYQEALNNYSKQQDSYAQRLLLDQQARGAGYNSYDAYTAALAEQNRASQAAAQQQAQQRAAILRGEGGNQTLATQDFLKQQTINRIQTLAPELGIPINPATGRPYGTVEAFKQPGVQYGLNEASQALSQQAQAFQQGRLVTNKLQGSPLDRAAYELNREASMIRTGMQTGKISDPFAGAGYEFLGGAVGLAKLDAEFPKFLTTIFKDPSLIKEIPGGIKKSFEDIGTLAKISPTSAIARLGGSFAYLTGPAKVIGELSDLLKTQLGRLSFNYIGDAKVGRTLEVRGETGKTIKLNVVGSIPTESVSSQARRAGETIPVVISSQANKYFGEVRKPIPGEAEFSQATKNLLKKFDAGIITKKELLQLDSLIKDQGAKGLLERSFFVDPTGKIRPSRLGIRPGEATPIDIAKLYEVYFTEDISISKPKPQILLFEDVRVQDYPPALRGIAKKLKTGQRLTEGEANAFLDFQLTKSGQFKPVGFLTRESELTLAPGELIKKVKTLGKTIVDGITVPIVKAEVYRPVGEVLELLKKIEEGRININEARALDKLLYKETGINYDLSSRYGNIKYVDPYKLSAEIGMRIRYGYSPRQNMGYYPGSRVYKPGGSLSVRLSTATNSPPRTGTSGRTSGTPGSPSKLSPPGRSPGTSSPPYSPPTLSPPTFRPRGPPPQYNPSQQEKKKYSGKENEEPIAYQVMIKVKGKMVRIPGLPLNKQDAQDQLAWIIDNKITRTAELQPVRSEVVGIIKPEQRGYFQKTFQQLRDYRIRQGIRIPLPQDVYIENGNKAISTAGEKRDLAEARRRALGSQNQKSVRNLNNKVSFTTKSGRTVSFIKK